HLVNAACAPVMTDDRAALQAGYVPLAPHRGGIAGQPGIGALPVPKPYGWHGLTKSAVEQSLPEAVGAFVAWLLKESGWKVTERERPGEAVPVSARHVCLLFRRFTSFGDDVTRPYVEALEARGIPHLLVGGRSFHLREAAESVRTAPPAVACADGDACGCGVRAGTVGRAGAGQRVTRRGARADVRGGGWHFLPRLRGAAAGGGGGRGSGGADRGGVERGRAHHDRSQGQGARVPGRDPRRHHGGHRRLESRPLDRCGARALRAAPGRAAGVG